MKKIILFSILFLLVIFAFAPKPIMAWSIGQPIVPQTCGQGTPASCCSDSKNPCKYSSCPCGIEDFFRMLTNIYGFIVWEIATPLAVIALIVGGIMMMISAGSADLFGKGKKIIFAAIAGLVLVFASYLIIDFVLKAIGYTANWSTIGS